MRRQFGVYFLALCFMLVPTAKVPAGEPTFTAIDVPGAIYTEAVGINSRGDIVGRYYDGNACTVPCFIADGHNHGYLLSQGSFTRIDFPNSDLTGAVGINPQGDIVGQYHLVGAPARMNHGYLLSGGEFTSIDFPGAFRTAALGINPRGDIVGEYGTFDLGPAHGFLLSGGEFTSIDFPDSIATTAWKINASGEIVGRYTDANGKSHVFLLSGGEFTSIDFPGAFDTAPRSIPIVGINARGDIVSTYCEAAPCFPVIAGNVHGFLLSKGEFTSIDVPEAVLTVAWGINTRGDIVGSYALSITCCDTSNKAHGYLLSRGEGN